MGDGLSGARKYILELDYEKTRLENDYEKEKDGEINFRRGSKVSLEVGRLPGKEIEAGVGNKQEWRGK